MSDEIVRRLMKKKNPLSIKESLLLEVDEDEEDEDDLDIDNLSLDDDEDDDTTPDQEDALDKKLSKHVPRPRVPKPSDDTLDKEEPIEDIPEPEEEETPKLEPTSDKDKGNVNPLDNIYAVNFSLGEEINIVYSDGTSTGIEGTIDGYDKEGFYRIRVRDGFTISGLTDIALSSLVKEVKESKCLCGNTHFVTEGRYIICDDCGRRIRESKEPLTIIDQSKSKKKKNIIRSIPHDMSTSVKPNISDSGLSEAQEDFSALESLKGEFWTRLSELVTDVEELGYEVVDFNREYIVVNSPDPEEDEQMKIPIGGTSRTLTLDLERSEVI